jgi:hypothetical protein
VNSAVVREASALLKRRRPDGSWAGRFPDLRLAVGQDRLALRHDRIFASLDFLPVTWDTAGRCRPA